MAFLSNKKHKFLEALKGDKQKMSMPGQMPIKPITPQQVVRQPQMAPKVAMPSDPAMIPNGPHVMAPKNIQPLPQMPQFDKLKRYLKKPGGM